MAGIAFVALLVVSTALLAYAGYVGTLVMRADFYTPQTDSNIDEVRALHRHIDEP